jgi:hypothetical protein
MREQSWAYARRPIASHCPAACGCFVLADIESQIMPNHSEPPRVLNDAQIRHFIDNGFIRIDEGFRRSLADDARSILWRDLGRDPDDPATWTKPVIRLGMYSQKPFVDAANTPTLHAAYDQLVGAGRWQPCTAMGTFPVRFPSPDDPGDTGWHVDMSFDWEKPNFMDWRVNVCSRGRALLMLFLFSDVERRTRRHAFAPAPISLSPACWLRPVKRGSPRGS